MSVLSEISEEIAEAPPLYFNRMRRKITQKIFVTPSLQLFPLKFKEHGFNIILYCDIIISGGPGFDFVNIIESVDGPLGGRAPGAPPPP